MYFIHIDVGTYMYFHTYEYAHSHCPLLPPMATLCWSGFKQINPFCVDLSVQHKGLCDGAEVTESSLGRVRVGGRPTARCFLLSSQLLLPG